MYTCDVPGRPAGSHDLHNKYIRGAHSPAGSTHTSSSVQLPGSQFHGTPGHLLLSAFGFHLPPTLLTLLPGQLGLRLPWEWEA